MIKIIHGKTYKKNKGVNMNIQGKYKDILSENNEIVYNPGWKSNRIVPDYGKLLAALMKKEFLLTSYLQTVGIEYIAIGSVKNSNEDEFKNLLVQYFNQVNTSSSWAPFVDPGDPNKWIWAKKIEADTQIEYLNESDEVVLDTITNKLRLSLKLEKTEPLDNTFVLNEFSLFSVPQKSDGTFDENNIFLINYVSHGDITKVNSMELSRTIQLTFPLE